MALNLQQVLQFLLCFILNLREVSEYKSPEACIWRGDLSEGFFCVMSLGGLYLEGLYMEGAYFRNFTVGWSSPVKALIISLVPLVCILDVKTLLS